MLSLLSVLPGYLGIINRYSDERQIGLLTRKITLKYHLMKTELVTSLKRKATDIIAEVSASRNPVLITQRGKPAAYLVDVETFEGLNQKLTILEGISRGERAIEEGNSCAHQEAKKRLVKWLK
jgi:prevent-host-death family protein